MTTSKEYKTADPFKREIMRQIAAGKHLIKNGWDESTCKLPADVHTLESVKDWYDKYTQQAGEP